MPSKPKNLIDRSVEIHEKLEGKVGAAFTSSSGVETHYHIIKVLH
ncbi:MAG: hypothetical protein QXO74_04605 [Candidatus Methanomethylicia archaeon]